MHLVLASDRWGEELGGRERYLADLEREARHAGHEVTVLDVRFRRALSARLVGHAGPILAPAPLPGATHCQLHSGLMEASLEAERDSLEGLPRAFFRAGTLLNPRRQLLLRLEEEVLSSPSRPRLMVWSRALQEEVARRHGIPAGEIAVLPPGVDLDRLPSEGPALPEEGPLRLLFVAHNFRLKGLAPLLDALARARRLGVNARLTVAGRGPVRAFQALAARLGVAEEVTFAGPVPPGRMAVLYRAHHALVHPTFHDPCSLAVLEALCSGLPVVTTRRNGATEWFEEGRHGLVIEDPRDARALAEAVGVLADTERRGRMAREAALLGPRFDFSSHAARVFEWLS